MRTTIVAGLVVLALASGCGIAIERPDAVARRASATPSTVISAGQPFDRAALAERVKKVLMAPGALVNLGAVGKPEDELDADYETSIYCNRDVIGEQRTNHVVHVRTWQSPGISVIQSAHGYEKITGKDAVDATRRNAQNCTTFQFPYSTGKITVDLLDVVDLGAVAGVDDSYGRCERRHFLDGSSQIACVAFLGRGKLLAYVSVYYGDTVASASAKLRQVVPIAAAALAAA